MIDPPEMIIIPAGRFIMGSVGDDRFANSTEHPAHEAVIERAFAVARFPVTESQWQACSGGGESSALPVVQVSWLQAMEFVAWLRTATRRPFRLLTETEWEYCCRAGTHTIFATGNDIAPAQANYLYDEHGFKIGPGRRTLQGCYPPNAFGLEDMHGNVCEWVADKWRPTYASASDKASTVIRGGAWDYLPRLLRSAWRDSAPPETQRDNLGFRVACDL
jgi:formylglycine-generating enzyme required for sulfatase activity